MSASRFAVLTIEGENSRVPKKDKKSPEQNKSSNNNEAVKKADQNKNNANTKKTGKKKKGDKERAELLALAFGGSKPSKSTKKKKLDTKSESSTTTWNEWQKRDTNFVDETFEQDLEEALLASKIDYEENKASYEKRQKHTNGPGINENKKSGIKKGTTMTLDQFTNLPKQSAITSSANVNNAPTCNEKFFENISAEAKKAIVKEKMLTIQKAKPDNSPRLAQLQEELRERDEEILKLKEENEKLREELLNVKTRNKRLCNILAQGEMREKAEILVQIEKLNKVKDELTAEVDNLAIQLQQERSKVTALTDSRKVHKKRQPSENEK